MSPSETPLQYTTAVHFGAGSIGLGFIGALLANAGYHVIFADVKPDIVSHLNQDHAYTIHYLQKPRARSYSVSNVSGVLSSDKDGIVDVTKHIADKETKLVTTSIGIDALKHIVQIMSKGITRRKEEGSGPLNVIACENGKGATKMLRDEVYKALDKETREWADQNIGFADSSVDRIVPQPVDEEEKVLSVGVSEFFEWIVDIHPLKSISRSGPNPALIPPIPGMVLTDNLPAYQTRKLFVFNCGHAVTAYLGAIFHHEVVSAAIADKNNVFPIVEGAMKESADALLKEYPIFDRPGMDAYLHKTLSRFQNPEVVDNVVRVGRNPLRKLGAEERLLGPFHLARKYGMPTKNLAIGIASALMYRNDSDEQAIGLKDTEQAHGVEGAVQKILGMKKDSGDFNEIMDAYNILSTQVHAHGKN